MVKWLERLDYGAEGRLGQLAIGKPSLSAQQIPINGCLFSNQGRIKQQKEKDGVRPSNAIAKIKWLSKPPLPLRPIGYGKPLQVHRL